MSTQSIEKFKEYLENQNKDFLQDGRRVEGIIRDIFPEEKALIPLLTCAWKAGVVAELGQSANVEVTIAQFGDRLSQEYSLRESSALTAVRLWAYALKVTDVVPDINDSSASSIRSLPVSATETKKCPFCAEEVKKNARKCKHCHSDISEGVIAAIEKAASDELIRQKEEHGWEQKKLEWERQELEKKAVREAEKNKQKLEKKSAQEAEDKKFEEQRIELFRQHALELQEQQQELARQELEKPAAKETEKKKAPTQREEARPRLETVSTVDVTEVRENRQDTVNASVNAKRAVEKGRGIGFVVLISCLDFPIFAIPLLLKRMGNLSTNDTAKNSGAWGVLFIVLGGFTTYLFGCKESGMIGVIFLLGLPWIVFGIMLIIYGRRLTAFKDQKTS